MLKQSPQRKGKSRGEGESPPDYNREERDWWARNALGETTVAVSAQQHLVHSADKRAKKLLKALKKALGEHIWDYSIREVHAVPRTLYVNRKVENAADIIAWAKSQGFKTTLPPEDMHVTIAFSRTPLSWPDTDARQLVVSAGTNRVVAQFSGGAVVLRFSSPELTRRWAELRNMGASWDWPSYYPHITLTYDSAGVNLARIVPYKGPINLHGEEFAEVQEDWKDSVVEKAGPTKDKSEVAYRDSPKGDQQCSKCIMYKPAGNACTLVKGVIAARGWCEEFDRIFKMACTWSEEIMEKIGARHSKKDTDMIQQMHDHACALGAKCPEHGGGTDFVGRSHQATPGGDKQLDKNYRIAKIDENLGMVFGYAIISKVAGEDYYDLNVDLSGEHAGKRVPEHIPESTMLKAAMEFGQTARVGNEMHKGPDGGTYLFVFPLTSDIAKAMGIDTNVTGLMVGYKPPADMLAKFRSGELKGFSIEGRRLAYVEHED